jgi:hypothetical protein
MVQELQPTSIRSYLYYIEADSTSYLYRIDWVSHITYHAVINLFRYSNILPQSKLWLSLDCSEIYKTAHVTTPW